MEPNGEGCNGQCLTILSNLLLLLVSYLSKAAISKEFLEKKCLLANKVRMFLKFLTAVEDAEDSADSEEVRPQLSGCIFI